MEDARSIGSLQSTEAKPPTGSKKKSKGKTSLASGKDSISTSSPSGDNNGTSATGSGSADAEKELKREKKLRKVLKEALTKEQEKVRGFEKEAEKLKHRIEELETEVKEKETKYLDLYMENSQQHEEIVLLKSQLKGNPFIHEVTLNSC
jgi:hypothetical protein